MKVKPLLPILGLVVTSALAEPVFITNEQVGHLDAPEAARILQARSNTFPDGSNFNIGTLSFSDASTNTLYENLVGKSAKRIESIWTKKQFSGKGVMPKEFSSPEELNLWVSKTKGAIAVIDSEHASQSVNVIRQK